MRIDTYVIRSALLSLEIIGLVLVMKGYLTNWVEVPLIIVTTVLYLIPRTVLEFERKPRGL